MARTTRGIAATIVMLGLPGCGDECRPSENHCDGNTGWTCVYESQCQECDSEYYWERTSCSGPFGTCVEVERAGETQPLCAASSEPEPACAGARADSSACVDELVVGCRYGYRTWETSCGAAELCITGDDPYTGDPAAFCALAPEPTPCCAIAAAEGSTDYCTGPDVGYDRVTCRDGYPVMEEAGSCEFGVPLCAACGSLTDPACVGSLCDLELGVCTFTCPCAAGYYCAVDEEPCLPDYDAPPCEAGCGLYACVEELGRCATHCVEDADCAGGAVCTDGACVSPDPV